MRRCGHVICRNLIEQQRLHCGSALSSSAAVIHNIDLDLSSLRHQSSRHAQHMHRTNRTHTTNSKATVAATEDDNASSTIHGTIPMHGKGLKMGQYAQVHRTFTQEDVNLFGRLSGDMNPVHFPPPPITTLSSQTISPTTTTSNNDEKLPIVHGILLSSLFSNIFGNLIPGAIYRHQSLKFHHAVRVNEDVVGRVVVTKLRQINRKGRGSGGGVLCVCDTSVIKMGVVAQKVVDNTTHDGNSNNPHDKSSNEEEKKEIVCISGDAQVWLPDLQLV
mmetsp:Transcript_29637/g.43558  ORF Transcript_29637/g.43558 Transcript_29637/m.43558 type:complete len:275 (-) Transcript_29637:1135-1959(-)